MELLIIYHERINFDEVGLPLPSYIYICVRFRTTQATAKEEMPMVLALAFSFMAIQLFTPYNKKRITKFTTFAQ
jgi:hypothetical protein